MNNLKKQGEEELKRALLMMKYDNRKTLTENVEVVSEEIPAYPAPKDEPIVKQNSNFSSGTKVAQEYAESGDVTVDTSLGLNEIPNGYSEEPISHITNQVSGDEGLVDALDFGISFSTDNFSLDYRDMNTVSMHIKGATGKCFKSSADGLYYPKIEGLRYLYSIDEDGDSLFSDLQDPPGTNSTNVMIWSQETIAEMVKRYQEWLDVMDETEANVDDDGKPTPDKTGETTPPPAPTPEQTPPPPPKQKYNPYRDIKTRKIYDDSQIER